ncbi:hypothetical protein P280DRAFT_358226, partial [Massarina eburnea CBS 473.64]
LVSLVALAATATAHGTVSGIVADGTYYGGYKLDYYYAVQNGQTPPATVGWSAENLDNGYVGGDRSTYDSPDIICHKNAENSNTTATVKAGGSLAFQWTTWPDSHMGPVITYAANCGGDCGSVDKTELKWVKVDASGYEDGKWAAIEMISNNNTYEMTVPSTLAAGKYVFRHEIIALHGAGSLNGAQNYPQCVNVEITGSGTDNPEGTLGEALYTADEDGILFNPYATTITYNIPGPALYGSGSGSSSSSQAATSAAATAKPSATSAAASSAQATSTAAVTSVAAVVQPVVSATATASKPASSAAAPS